MPEHILRRELENSWLLIASDGGLTQFSKLGIVPDILVGDMDSLDDAHLSQCRPRAVIEYPRNKGKSDTELAIDVALKRQADSILLLSATGRRIDHLFSNITLLTKFAGRVFLYDGEFTAFALDRYSRSSTLNCGDGTIFSVFAFGERVERLSIAGAKWEVNAAQLAPCSLGLSNESASAGTSVSIEEGILIVFARCGAERITVGRSQPRE